MPGTGGVGQGTDGYTLHHLFKASERMIVVMEFEPVIGLEVHAQLKAISKNDQNAKKNIIQFQTPD
jgi:hypothetical protein